jgi:molybdenum cofactor cytidylyltransferase
MGAWKPLLPFGSATILQTVVERALAACARVVLVTGYRGSELSSLFTGEPRVVLVENPDWQLGMFSSLRCGAACVSTKRFFVTLGDMPWISPEVYTALLQSPLHDIVFPVFAGRRGHPVLLGARAAEEIAREDAAHGSMRSIASRLDVGEIAWGDASIHRDIDFSGDYNAAGE